MLELIDDLDAHEARFTARIATELHNDRGYTAVQALPGIGPTLPAVFVAEIGTCTGSLIPLTCAPGPVWHPGTASPFAVVRRGHTSKQGSNLVRWAAVEAIQRHPAGTTIAVDRTPHRGPSRQEHRQGRRGEKIAHPRLLRAARRAHPRTDPHREA